MGILNDLSSGISKMFSSKVTKSSISQMADTGVKGKSVKISALNKEFGTTGNEIYAGYIYDDYNTNLRGSKAVDTYEEMRKSDAQISALLKICKYPILSAGIQIKPYTDAEGNSTPEDEERAKFIKDALMEYMNKNWDQTLQEILTCLDFGFSVFEKVYYSDGEHVWIKNLGFRRQQSIEKWEQSDGSKGITQIIESSNIPMDFENKNQIDIPADKLLIFTYRREGDNYAGISVLREAYKHWYIKDKLYRYDAIGHERGAGFPVINLPKGASDDDKKAALEIVKNIRMTKETGIVVPGSEAEGYSFKFASPQSGKSPSMKDSIDHHNREISKVILSQWLELGNTESGSFALQKDQSNFTTYVIQGVAKMIENTINWHLIPELIDLNYDNVEFYPSFQFNKINKLNVAQIAEVINSSISSGLITADMELEQHVREQLDLPVKSEEEIAEIEQNKEDIKVQMDKVPQKEEIEKEKVEVDDGELEKEKQMFDKLSGMINNEVILELQQELSKEEFGELKKKLNLRFNEYESKAWRPLTFAERKINLDLLKKKMRQAEQKADEAFAKITSKQKEDLLKQVAKAVEKNDLKKLDSLKVKYKGEIAQLLTDTKKDMFELGKKTASSEMGVSVPGTNSNVSGAMRVENNKQVAKVISDMETGAGLAVTQLINKTAGSVVNVSPSTATSLASDTIDNILNKAKGAMMTISINGGLNLGRQSVFSVYPEKVYALQYSAIIDDRTSNMCLSLDGRVVRPGSQEAYQYTPPNHPYCRSIWVEILTDEVFPPKITGIPNSIPVNTDINNMTQLKTPIIEKGSFAIKVLQNEIAQRQAKIDDYKARGIYPNLIDTHQTRIDELNKSIKKAMKETILELARSL